MLTKIKQSILKTLKDRKLYIFFTVTLLFFGILVVKQYAVDSYMYFSTSWKDLFTHILSLGRIVTAFFWLIFSVTNYSITYIVSYIIAIVFTTLSMYELDKILKRDIKDEKITTIISILTVINICILELFMYMEKGILILSIYFTILAIGNIDEALNGNKKAWIKIFFLMLIANCCYQGTVGLFVAFGTIYIIKNSKKIGEFIKNNIIVAILYGLPALCNFLFIKLVFNSERLGNETPILEKITAIIHNLINATVNSFGILPRYVFFGFSFLIGIIFVVKLFVDKAKSKNNIVLNIFFLIYVIAAVVFTSSMPQLLQNEVYMAPRNMYTFGAIFAVLILLLCERVNITKKLSTIILTISIVFLITEYYNFSEIVINNHYTNMKDREIASQIVEMIYKYEAETNNKVTKIVVYMPDGVNSMYKDVRGNGDANVRLFFTSWGINGMLNGLTGRSFEVEQRRDIEKEEHFKTYNRNNFYEEQVVFENNELHLYVI